MKIEPAILFMIEIGSVVFLFLFLPLMIALRQFPQIWRHNRGTGAFLGIVIFWTLCLFATLFATFAGLVYSGSQAQ